MELAEYLAQERGRCAAIAKAIDVAPAYLTQMASGARPVQPSYVPALEAECEFKVRRWEMRPHDWHRIWPELVGAIGAPPVPESEAV